MRTGFRVGTDSPAAATDSVIRFATGIGLGSDTRSAGTLGSVVKRSDAGNVIAPSPSNGSGSVPEGGDVSGKLGSGSLGDVGGERSVSGKEGSSSGELGDDPALGSSLGADELGGSKLGAVSIPLDDSVPAPSVPALGPDSNSSLAGGAAVGGSSLTGPGDVGGVEGAVASVAGTSSLCSICLSRISNSRLGVGGLL